jgi:sigma-B regulation protein RsbU (phosphoserine phosphatase)
VIAATPYVKGSCELGPGDVLMVYSDGITESQNCAGEEFGDARLEAQLRLARSGDANAMLFSMLGAVQDFAAASPLVDDMTLAIIRRDSR